VRRGRRERPVTPAPRHRSHGRAVAVTLGGLAASGVLLVMLGYVVGHGADVGLGGFVESVLAAATGAVTGTVLAFVLLIAAGWCVRRLWLEWLAWQPGQILIPPFSAGSKLSNKADPVHLTATFRQRFAAVRLQSPAPVPGAPPEGDYMEVLGQKSLDGGNVLGAVVAIANAAKPRYAYVVHGVLLERREQPKYGVTIQVVRVPEEGAPPETVYDITWERALHRAADRAMAHILPRTRRCSAPWATWRGFVMPTELLETYEAAARAEEERRYDQALAGYFAALERDPMNLSLRLHIGHLQEKLGLYLDALATYEGMLAVARQDDKATTKLYRAAARRERAEVMVVARYRRLVLLGGPSVAEQWRYTNPPELRSERDDQRDDLRRRLRERLCVELVSEAQPAEKVARNLRDPTPREDAAADADRALNELRYMFTEYARVQIGRLKRDLHSVRVKRGDAVALTRTSLELTKICLDIRLEWIERQLQGKPERWIWNKAKADDLVRDVTAICNRRRLSWHDHYNAACALALPLLVAPDPPAAADDSQPPEDDSPAGVRRRLAREAVRHLEQANACADSGYIATRRDWLLSEDPDLDGLRTDPAFKAFENMYFPAPVATPRRPRQVQRLEVCRYTRDLLEATARRWQTEWHDRRSREPLDDPHELISWWEHEAEVWAHVGRVAWNHRRWRVRCDLLERMDELSVHYKGAPLAVAFRTFEEPWMSRPDADPVDKLAKAALKRATKQLRDLASRLSQDPTRGVFRVDGIHAWTDKLRDNAADGTRPNADDVVRLCDRHAAVWESLRLWVTEGDPDAVDQAGRRFAEQLAKLEAQLRGRPRTIAA
jgi:tetratricopeptide (TPR) repeat protein